jgi:hypothetical protein
MAFGFIFTIVVFNLTPLLIAHLGLGRAVYFFAFNSFVGGIFIIFYVPETVGMSLLEIAEMMKK